MKIKRLLIIISMIMIIVCCTGCAQDNGNSETRTVEDMLGKIVQLPDDIDSYCVLYSSAVPMCAMMDKELEHMVQYPVSDYFAYWDKQMFPNLNEHAEIVDKKTVTAEQIIESGAQVVFWSKASHEELVASLEEAGIACVNLRTSNEDDLFEAVNIVAQTFGTEYAHNQAEKYIEYFKNIKTMVTTQVSAIPENEKKSILVLGDTDSLTSYGSETYVATWPKIAGLNYISPIEGDNNITLTMEQIYEFDPDIIDALSIFDVEELSKEVGWENLRAVKEKRLYSNPMVLDVWGEKTTETPLQFVWALSEFYPNYLGDIDPVSVVADFYSKFYAYNMSRDDAKEILEGVHRLLK